MMNRATAAEEDFFRREEAERRRDEAWESLQRAATDARAERARLKALGVLLCPKCRTALEPRTLRGVEVQRCASCSGTWLADGKLEELSRSESGPVDRFLAALRGGSPSRKQ